MKTTAKVIIVGDTGVGKSCIVSRMIGCDFIDGYHPTIGFTNSEYKEEIDNQEITVKLWDTAGQEKYMSLTQMYFKGTDIAILTYDITQKNTFEKLSVWDEALANNGITGKQVIIVGNKSDLEEKREVSPDEGNEYAEGKGRSFIEVSAKTQENIEPLKKQIAEAFVDIFNVKEIKDEAINQVDIGKQPNKKKDDSSCC